MASMTDAISQLQVCPALHSRAKLTAAGCAAQMLRTTMSTAQQAGLTVMRAWTDGVSEQYALQTSPGEYSEAIFRGLDYVLDQARQQGIRVSMLPIAQQ